MSTIVKPELLARVRDIVGRLRHIRIAGVQLGLEVGVIEAELAVIEEQVEHCIDEYQAALYHKFNHPRNEQTDANGLLGRWQQNYDYENRALPRRSA